MRVPKISRTLTLDRILALSSYSRPNMAVLSQARPIVVLSRPIVAVPYLLSPSSSISYSVLQGRLFFFLPATSSPVSLVSVVPRYSVTLIPNEQKRTETISPLIRPPPL